MSKEEVIAAIQQSAVQVGHPPSLPELEKTMKITRRAIQGHFPTYREALRAAGLERTGGGYKNDTGAMLLDWAETVRKLGKVPTTVEYNLHGEYSLSAMRRRFRVWGHMPSALLEYARKEGLKDGWEDVLTTIGMHMKAAAEDGRSTRTSTGTPTRPRILTDRPVYGRPMMDMALGLAPTNEMGVVFLFGTMAKGLGFVVIRLQSEFPDCEAFREVEPGRWQWVRIEFEYESRNFLAHGHRLDGCDLIICWKHNWEGCPLEVLELSTVIADIARDRKPQNLTAD
jgi:hypothetical protein